MEDSILLTVKQVLDIPADNTAFDFTLLIHINSAFATLNQLGVGPATVFEIEDDTAVWATFLDGDSRFNAVKTYVCLKVKSVFDPPSSAYAVTAMKEQIMEHEWRLNTAREETDWVAPVL